MVEKPSGPGAVEVLRDFIILEISSMVHGSLREEICESLSFGKLRDFNQSMVEGGGFVLGPERRFS